MGREDEWDFDATTIVESNRRIPKEETPKLIWSWWSARIDFWPSVYNGAHRHAYRQSADRTSDPPWRSLCGLGGRDILPFFGWLPRCRTCQRIAGYHVKTYVRRRPPGAHSAG